MGAASPSRRTQDRAYQGAVTPRVGNSGALLAQYSRRLGSAILRHRVDIAERAARIEAELASLVKSEFIANMSHELRTPLNSIIGFARMLAAGQTPDPRQLGEYGSYILGSATGLLDIVNDLIEVSKLQSGKFDLDRETTDPEEVLDPAAAFAEARAREAGLKFLRHMDADMPPLLADGRRLTDILQRLLKNAVTFTPAGGTVALIGRPGPAKGWVLAVADTGRGMSEEELETALTPFGQADMRLERSHGGTGLGLTISRLGVEAMGGHFTISSEKGKGTDVVIVLPGAEAANG